MAATPEKKVKDKVRKILDAAGAYHFMPATHGFGASGIPDIIGCYHGTFFAIECKAGAGRTTALQDRNLGMISKAGGFSEVINESNLIDVELMLARIKAEYRSA
jgi:Holliday junction resolvase